jgi:exo-beta-1,3-glucanase (GH17 family)
MGILHQKRVMDGAFPSSSPLAHAGLPRSELAALLRKVLADRVHGICYSAYLDGQGPDLKTQLGPEQIRARMEIVRPHARWVRTFSCTDGNEASPGIAHQMGLKTLVGAWIGDDPRTNEREIAGALKVARAGHADIVAIGNEVLLRGDQSEDEIIASIRKVKEALPGIPVGYVDAYYLFCEHPRLVEACDVLLINCYPFWEKCPLESSLGYMKEMVRRVTRAAGGKKIVISETGWPSAGDPVGAAVPSVEGALLYALNTFEWAAQDGIEVFYFSSFDEEWKAGPEGGCGPHWGFWDTQGRFKYQG